MNPHGFLWILVDPNMSQGSIRIHFFPLDVTSYRKLKFECNNENSKFVVSDFSRTGQVKTVSYGHLYIKLLISLSLAAPLLIQNQTTLNILIFYVSFFFVQHDIYMLHNSF